MAENAFLLASMPSCEPVQNTEPGQNTWQLKAVEALLCILVDLGLAVCFLGSGRCTEVAFWFALFSILWVLKLLWLCEVVWSLQRVPMVGGRQKVKAAFTTWVINPSKSREIAVVFLSFRACGAEPNSAQMPLNCAGDLCTKW